VANKHVKFEITVIMHYCVTVTFGCRNISTSVHRAVCMYDFIFLCEQFFGVVAVADMPAA